MIHPAEFCFLEAAEEDVRSCHRTSLTVVACFRGRAWLSSWIGTARSILRQAAQKDVSSTGPYHCQNYSRPLAGLKCLFRNAIGHVVISQQIVRRMARSSESSDAFHDSPINGRNRVACISSAANNCCRLASLDRRVSSEVAGTLGVGYSL